MQREIEAIEHLFIHCHVALSICGFFLKESGMSWCFPRSLVELIESWRGCAFCEVRLDFVEDHPPFSYCGLFGKRGMKEFLVEENHLGRVVLPLCF